MPSGAYERAASVLEERFGEIFEDYDRRLGDISSLLMVGEGGERERRERQARSLMARAAEVLRGAEISGLEIEEEVYRNVEASEEPLDPHPDESLRAGLALCEAAVAAVVGRLPDLPPAEVAGISLLVVGVVMDRASRVLMASYVDYLLTKVRETQFEERRRFSRELHDRLAHSMATVNVSLELYETLRDSDPARAEARLRQARQVAGEAIEMMRGFAAELRESQTSDGLRIALENLVRISVPPEVETSISFEGDEARLPDFVRDQLYLILREGVRNAVAHSGTDRMSVEVAVTPEGVRAAIADRGLGAETPPSEGLGISSMRERAELLGGAFELASDPERGTRIEVRLPLAPRG